MAGSRKLSDMDSTIAWFGNADWGLGLPLPALLAWLATDRGVRRTAVTDRTRRALGFDTAYGHHAGRWVYRPWQNGWLAIASGSGLFATERTIAATERLGRAKSILQEHGNMDWLTEHGNFVVLNNGIEFAATYFVMLLALLYLGSGKAGADYWINRRFQLGF